MRLKFPTPGGTDACGVARGKDCGSFKLIDAKICLVNETKELQKKVFNVMLKPYLTPDSFYASSSSFRSHPGFYFYQP